MDICTISKLANEAGVSVYVVRDYVLRGLEHMISAVGADTARECGHA